MKLRSDFRTDSELLFLSYSVVATRLMNSIFKGKSDENLLDLASKELTSNFSKIGEIPYSEIKNHLEFSKISPDLIISISHTKGFDLLDFIKLFSSPVEDDMISDKFKEMQRRFFNHTSATDIKISDLLSQEVVKEYQWRLLSAIISNDKVIWDLDETKRANIRPEMYSLLFS